MSPLPIAARAARARCGPATDPKNNAVLFVDEIHLLTGTGNRAAQAAYRKAGFREHQEVYMTKAL